MAKNLPTLSYNSIRFPSFVLLHILLRQCFGDDKHNYNQRPFSFIVNRQVAGLVQFNASLNILIRVITPREHFSSFVMVKLSLGILFLSSSAIKQCGLEPAQFKGHSFRIGATSHAATLGSTDSQIRVLGHWKSNASRKYIRIDSFSA